MSKATTLSQLELHALKSANYTDKKVVELSEGIGEILEEMMEENNLLKEDVLLNQNYIRTINTDIGSLPSLETDHKTSLTGAINELHDNIEKRGAFVTPQMYDAKGDGTTDDTVAFQNALAANRVVFVPGGTYKLSGTLVIRENCCLELSQDTILDFKQTSGNCIEMRGSAVLRGNHGNIHVPYAFIGNAISVDTLLDGTNHASIPPYAKADPMFKRQRFIYDVNILKANSAGFCRTSDGVCNGTALYISATNVEGSSVDIPYIWAMTVSGLRIAGGFSYGVRAVNYDSKTGYTDDGWNHDMRLEAVIEACEVGVSLENCNCAHLQVTVQPCQATNGTAYAKWGVYLKDSKNVDMVGSRVWDWNAKNSLWAAGGMYQHIAMVDDCHGLILDDFIYHETSADIYSLIYTNLESNFEKMTILQERFDRYFKSVNGVPYFNDGTLNKKLMLATEKFLAEQTDFIFSADGEYITTPLFTNLVTAAGYTNGKGLSNTGSEVSGGNLTLTGYIPVKTGAKVIRIAGSGVAWNVYGCCVMCYDANKAAISGGAYPYGSNKLGSGGGWGTLIDDPNSVIAWNTSGATWINNSAAYIRIGVQGKGANLIVTIDEEIAYKNEWQGEPKRLDESIYAQSVFLKSPNGTAYKLKISDSGAISAEKI